MEFRYDLNTFEPSASSRNDLFFLILLLQMNISTQINQMDSKELNKKKNEDYAKFLEITNRKTAIFRDIIIESECESSNSTFL